MPFMPTRASEILETMRTLGTICMTWWVSATVLCATILGLAWAKRADLRQARPAAMHGLFAIGFIFFASIVLFGIVIIEISTSFGRKLRDACLASSQTTCATSDAKTFTRALQWGVGIGTSSFAFCCIAWIVAWIEVARTQQTPT